MGQQLYKNNAFGSLSGGISDSSTVISLATGQGARFPSPTGGDYFLATLIGVDGNGAENAWEIVKVTARATDGLTVVRGQEGTTAVAWSAGARIEMRITAGTLSNIATSSNNAMAYVNSSATLAPKIHYFIDSTSGSFAVNMPSSPSLGDIVELSDALSSWAANPVTLNRNGSNFVDPFGNSQAENFILNVAGLTLSFIYTASGWRAI
ncbi:MAG: hypothetical protein HRU77_01480 [Gammaproteobacteria bacterium]|nr:MAG: hypothetical protein HRU77_01480 [Gammaproteobacteria bacterium]